MVAEYGYQAERQIRVLEGQEEIAEPQNCRWEFKRIVDIRGKVKSRCGILRKTVLNQSVKRNWSFSEILKFFSSTGNNGIGEMSYLHKSLRDVDITFLMWSFL